jgi:lipoprotein-releasing system permease protein
VAPHNQARKSDRLLEWFLARRLLSSQRRSYVFLVSAISRWGLAFGVASLVVIFSVTSGFEEVFREKVLGLYPHMVVIGRGGDLPEWREVRERLSRVGGVVSATPATYDEMMASHRGRRSGSIVKGVDSAAPGVVALAEPFMEEGHPSALRGEPECGRSGPGTVACAGMPGGGTYVVAVAASGEVLSIPAFEEDAEIPRLRLISLLEDEVEAELGGVLKQESFVLARHVPTRYVEVVPGSAQVRVEGRNLALDAPVAGNASAVVWRRADRSLVATVCREPAPGAASDPAHVCIVNASDRPVRWEFSGAREESGGLPEVAEALPGRATEVRVRAGRLPGVILGAELARRIEARVGDEVRLVSPLMNVPGVAAGRRPGRAIADTFVVVGVISLGFFEYDSKLALIDFSAARRFLHQGDMARWMEVRVQDLFAMKEEETAVGRMLSRFSLLDVAESMPPLAEKYTRVLDGLTRPQTAGEVIGNLSAVVSQVKFSNVEGELSMGYDRPYRIISWEEMNEPLFASMKRQRIVLSLFFLIMVVVAAFNVVSSQTMIVREKSGDISILKAMGASDGQVRRVFLLQGLTIGVKGTLLGLAVGVGLCGLLSLVGFPLDPKVYFVSELPVHMRAGDIALAAVVALASAYIAVSVAARQAARKDPVEGLRELE